MPSGKGSRARPRKRRQARGRPRPGADRFTPDSETPKADASWQADVQVARRRRPSSAAVATAERPRPPWHPLPLAEILILAGAVSLVVGLLRGPNTGGRTAILLGVVAVGTGTIEFSVREHLSGFRSHTTLLALLPVVVFHTLVVLVVSVFTPVTRTITLATAVADVAVFATAVRLLRLRIRDARHERVSGLGQRGRRGGR